MQAALPLVAPPTLCSRRYARGTPTRRRAHLHILCMHTHVCVLRICKRRGAHEAYAHSETSAPVQAQQVQAQVQVGQVGAGKVGGKGIFSAQINVRRRCACRLLLVCGSHFLTPASHCLLTPASYHLPPSYFLLPTADRASCRTRVHRRRSLFLQPSAHNLPTANCLQPSYSHLPTTFLQPTAYNLPTAICPQPSYNL